ncbi:MAG: hypothetical protein GY865_19850 [candidate division Zixibacteria bacterium]|nr:hypothetical protein [candidate division Zixibacteria bacterium]
MNINLSKTILDLDFASRLWVYLKEMFPIVPRFAISVFLFLGFTLYLSKITQVSFTIFTVSSLIGIGFLFTVALILRLMDELKDRQTDMILFKDRPLPSGRVKEADIKFALAVASVTYICFHLYSEQVFLSSLIVLGYTFLMFRYFFLPEKMHNCLLLNLATHNPVTVLILLHLTTIFTVQYNTNLANLNWLLLALIIVKFWFLFLSWEIARKIRYPQEETEYITYSRIFGYIYAAIISLFIQTISYGIALYLYYALSLSIVYLVIITIGYKILIFGYLRFLFKKMPTGIKLRSLAEFYAIVMMLAIIVESIWNGGL